MRIKICSDNLELGRQAASEGGDAIVRCLKERGSANVILATGASQFATLENLSKRTDVDWTKVHFFHLDEYLGMPATHPASFRKYLRERFVEKLPVAPARFEYIDGEENPRSECARLAEVIRRHPIDVAFIGIGENGHLAFNDPPADFETPEPYIVVQLDEACRQQQFGEGWFPHMDDVPRAAISMSIKQILLSKLIICSVPDQRKAIAVRGAVEAAVSPDCPATKLREHSNTTLYLDPPSASLLSKK